jgi:hypothetical protein
MCRVEERDLVVMVNFNQSFGPIMGLCVYAIYAILFMLSYLCYLCCKTLRMGKGNTNTLYLINLSNQISLNRSRSNSFKL